MAPTRETLLTWCSRAARAWVYLVLGGVVAAAYLVLVSGLVQLARAAPEVPIALTAAIVVIAIPIALTPPLLTPLRDIEIAAVRSLLDVEIAARGGAPTWDDRLRSAGYLVAHVLLGGAAVLVLLFGIPSAVGLIGVGLGARGDGFVLGVPDLGGWGVPLGVLVLLAIPVLALPARRQLRSIAPALLGPGAGERELAERRRATVLAERNRIARELHDGVGHALAITTMQASVAEAAIGRDEETVRRAVAEIARVGREAMADLDRSLAVLREDDPAREPRAPRPLLDGVTRLAGDGVRLRGEAADLAGLPATTSREAYQILAEAVVNARRHGTGTVEIGWRRSGGTLRLDVSNAVRPAARSESGGRGLIGMRERAGLIGATVRSEPDGGTWRFELELDTTR